jgi:hypothetical protein
MKHVLPTTDAVEGIGLLVIQKSVHRQGEFATCWKGKSDYIKCLVWEQNCLPMKTQRRELLVF